MRPEEQDVAHGGDSRRLALFCSARVAFSFLFTSYSAAPCSFSGATGRCALMSWWLRRRPEAMRIARGRRWAEELGIPSGRRDRSRGGFRPVAVGRTLDPHGMGAEMRRRVCSAPIDCNQGKRAPRAQAQSPWRLSVLDRIFRNRRESSHPPAGGRELPQPAHLNR